MNSIEFNLLKDPLGWDVITADCLYNKEDHTLLWGYDCSRSSWHVYLKDGEFHLYRYDSKKETVLYHNYGKELSSLDLVDLIPQKRAYPEACAYSFCRLIKEYGLGIPFTTFSETREESVFYGDVYGG